MAGLRLLGGSRVKAVGRHAALKAGIRPRRRSAGPVLTPGWRRALRVLPFLSGASAMGSLAVPLDLRTSAPFGHNRFVTVDHAHGPGVKPRRRSAGSTS
jgi:hypothetical protein